MIKIGILAVTNCMYSSVTGPYDFFSVASYAWENITGKTNSPLFDVKIISPGKKNVTCFNGLQITSDLKIEKSDLFDIIIVPVIFGDLEPVIANEKLINWLIEQSNSGACLSSVCAGSFLIAQTGLLSGKQATTHWILAKQFQERFSDVILKKEKMLVDEGDFITAGGVTAYMDLSLCIAGKYGSRELVSSLSKLFLIDPARRTQSSYMVYNACKQHGDIEILKVQEWIESNYSELITISTLASIAGLGERTFARRFKKATGDTPIEYLQQIRIEIARDMLETTNNTVDSITQDTGYEDVSSFRRLFKKYTGLSPSGYRKKFSALL